MFCRFAKNFLNGLLHNSGLYMKNESQKKYSQTDKGKKAAKRAQNKYDKSDIDRRREQKRNYMRRKRSEDPNYCKWR